MGLESVAAGYGGYADYDYRSGRMQDRGDITGENERKTGSSGLQEPEDLQEKPLSEMSYQDMMDFVRQRSRVILEKLKNGDTETKIKIGGAEYTEKEWNKMLERVDEAIRQMQEEDEKDKEKHKTKEEEKAEESGQGGKTRLEIMQDLMDEIRKDRGQKDSLLLGKTEEELAAAVSESSASGDKKTLYVTAFTGTGISCKSSKQGIGDPPLWEISFQGPEDYKRVTDFLNRFGQSENLTFASNQSFWQDFLSGEIDEDEFYRFYENREQEISRLLSQPDKDSVLPNDNLKYLDYSLERRQTFPSYEAQQADQVQETKRADQEVLRREGPLSPEERWASYYEELFTHTAEGVREAWEAAAKETGADGSGREKDGKLTHISQLTVERLLGNHQDYSTILGTSVQSAYEFAGRAADNLIRDLHSGTQSMNRAAKEKELEFYQAFLRHLAVF